jgi:ubiquinone/menaquinone biosynthesis C-methylase UbiE
MVFAARASGTESTRLGREGGRDIAEVFILAAADIDHRPKIDYVLGDGAVLPFASSSFDVATTLRLRS